MVDGAPFPDLEAAVVTLLDDLASTGTVTPTDLQTELPFIRVTRLPGSDDGWTDSAVIVIDAFAERRPDAWDLAEAVRQRFLSYPLTVGSVLIDKATTVNSPNDIPWSDDQSVRRFTASYRVTTRR